MTLLVELVTYNGHNNGCVDLWKSDLVNRLYRNLPSTSPLCQYAVTRYAVNAGNMTQEKWEAHPKSFMIDLLLVAIPVKGGSIKRKLKEENCDSCNFHEHKGDKEAIAACKMRQQKEGLWFSSFLRACMSEVYDMEDAMLESKSHAQTEENPKYEPDMLEKKEDKAMPSSAGVGLPSDSTFSFTIPRGVDGRSQMEPPVSIWEDLEAYDDYEILLHGG
ncbi:uncharacterized protein J4E79_008507 [Alternaria viburni]|uniref:uncharacterized protein n=1 Tax=Alternaria viburni TaxID=566460 RepID=UPI0020C52E72|nr:uncharacterized protein J4E79_008507 [Alternaria viburni]KAI4654633.1 hypothetical protein J4E79_008507 [Alternaria viburni]